MMQKSPETTPNMKGSSSPNISKARQTINKAYSYNRINSRNLLKEDMKPMHESLTELLRNVGIDVPDSMAALAHTAHPDAGQTAGSNGNSVRFEESQTSVVLPSCDKPQDLYTKASDRTRESTFMRMENLFDEVNLKIKRMRYSEELTEAEKMELPGDLEEYSSASLRNTGKPTVIGDAIPPPMHIPPAVQHVRILILYN